MRSDVAKTIRLHQRLHIYLDIYLQLYVYASTGNSGGRLSSVHPRDLGQRC